MQYYKYINHLLGDDKVSFDNAIIDRTVYDNDNSSQTDWYIRTEKNLRVVRKRVITGNKRVSGT